MFKHLLIKCCNLIGREDISNELRTVESVDDINNAEIKNDVMKLISYYNYVSCSLYENYLKLFFTEKITSNSKSQIEYFVFSYKPIKIVKVEDENLEKVDFKEYPSFIITPAPKRDYYVTYRYSPLNVKHLAENIKLPKDLDERVLCYGIASEFLASKGKFDESEFFNNKFLYEIFKIKSKKERRLKSTFCLW